MITDTINKDWLIKTNELADLYDAGEKDISEFTIDQLHYLVYWNWGYSGPVSVPETKAAEAELIRRGNPFDVDYAVSIIDITEELY
jgi:hypothetical protein